MTHLMVSFLVWHSAQTKVVVVYWDIQNNFLSSNVFGGSGAGVFDIYFARTVSDSMIKSWMMILNGVVHALDLELLQMQILA